MAPARCLERTVPNESLNPFAGIFPLPPPKHAARKAEATEQYRYVKKDRSKCAARVADLRATEGGGHLQPLNIVAACYISDKTADSYVFSLQELESVRLSLLYGLLIARVRWFHRPK
jgi:hypothetical protein